MRHPQTNDSAARHLVLGVSAHLLTGAFILLGKGLAPRGPTAEWGAWAAAVAVWVAVYLTTVFGRHWWPAVRPLGYYFLPTAVVLWALEIYRSHRALQRAHATLSEQHQALLRRFDELLASVPPDARVQALLGQPDHRGEALAMLRHTMLGMSDLSLALALDKVHGFAWQLDWRSEEYADLKAVVGRLPTLLQEQDYSDTWGRFLRLLKDVFEPDTPTPFASEVRRDLVVPLTEAVIAAADPQRERLLEVVRRVMAQRPGGDDIARWVLLAALDERCNKHVRDGVLREAVTRAKSAPRGFGSDLLHSLNQLEHRVFWVDVHTLQDMVMSEVVTRNREAYESDLCRGIFCPLEDPRNPGKCHGRVFRRLDGGNADVQVECHLRDGSPCKCVGRRLSFGGVYSSRCSREINEPIPTITVRVPGNAAGPIPMAFVGEVARRHSPGRGIAFREGSPHVVRALYDHIAAAGSQFDAH